MSDVIQLVVTEDSEVLLKDLLGAIVATSDSFWGGTPNFPVIGFYSDEVDSLFSILLGKNQLTFIRNNMATFYTESYTLSYSIAYGDIVRAKAVVGSAELVVLWDKFISATMDKPKAEPLPELFTPPLIKIIEGIDLKNTPAEMAFMSGFYKRVEYNLGDLHGNGRETDFMIYRTGLTTYRFYVDGVELFKDMFSEEFLERVHQYMIAL